MRPPGTDPAARTVSTWVLLVLLAPAVAVAVWRNEGRRSRQRAATVALDVTAGGVQRTLADGREEGIAWRDVRVVEVVRASLGPHRASGGVVLLGGEGDVGCLVPLDRIGDSGLVEQLSRLPGFDIQAFTAALEARAPSRTVVWGTRPGDEDDGAEPAGDDARRHDPGEG